MKRLLIYFFFVGSVATVFSQEEVCYGTSTKFSVDITDGPNGTPGSQYTWNIVEPGFTGVLSPSANSVTIDWTTPPGTYTLTVQETNTGCAGTLVSETITVHDLPVVSFSDPDDTICDGSSVTVSVVTDPADGGGDYTYVWTVPAGQTNPGNVSSFMATTDGQYTVQATNLNLGCSSTSSAKMLNVVDLPTASVSPSGTIDLCNGESVTLNATTSSGTILQWYNASGAIAGETGSSLTVTQTEDYYVTVTNADGCSENSNTVTVNINPLPAIAITASGNTTICDGANVELVASTNAGNSLQWYDASGMIAGETGSSLTVTQGSDYFAMVTDANGCENTSTTITVTKIPLPSVTISAMGGTTICQGESLTLTATADPGTSLQWSNDDGQISGATSNSLQVTNSYGYYVTAVNANGCEKDSGTITVTVNPIPVTSAIKHN